MLLNSFTFISLDSYIHSYVNCVRSFSAPFMCSYCWCALHGGFMWLPQRSVLPKWELNNTGRYEKRCVIFMNGLLLRLKVIKQYSDVHIMISDARKPKQIRMFFIHKVVFLLCWCSFCFYFELSCLVCYCIMHFLFVFWIQTQYHNRINTMSSV